MVLHARVNEGLSQTPAPGRRPSLEEKSHLCSLPRRHRNHVLFDMVPFLWSLPTNVNVSLCTNITKVWRGFCAAAAMAATCTGEVSVAESKWVHLCCFLGVCVTANAPGSEIIGLRIGNAAKHSRSKKKKTCWKTSPAMMGALYCKSTFVHLSVRRGVRWLVTQQSNCKSFKCTCSSSMCFQREKHNLMRQNSPQKGNKCSNVCLIQVLLTVFSCGDD